jgi:protein SCO1/2
MNRCLRLLLLLVLACAAGGAFAAKKTAPLPGDSVYQLPATMTDQAGRDFDWGARRGRTQLVAMFYTSCPYVCPLIVDSGKAIEHALPPAELARLDILLVSIDPVHDTPAALKQVADKRGLDPARWTLARPQPDDVRALAGVLGVRYRQLADGNFNHTSALVLLDADGRVVARTERVGSVVDPEFLAAVRAQLAPPGR